ncbi:MAG: glycosyltransferase [Bacteroidetes bacterium]|nr:glycosyltransferase [Bacteroidota bacterium]
MKVTYLSIGEASPGVSKKLKDKTESFREAGLDVHLVMVGTGKDVTSDTITELEVSQSLSQKIGKFFILWRFSVALEQLALYKATLKWIRSHPADVILFRYPVSDFFLWWFMLRCQQRVVFEYNTIEITELNLRRSTSFYYQYFYWSERVFGKMVRSRSSGIIGVTPEIANYQSKLAGGKIPTTSISNGINVERVAKHRDLKFDGRELTIVLLAGSQAQWHGVDILLRSLSKVTGDCLINCFLAGQITEQQKEYALKLPNVTVLPGQFGEDLDRLMDQCHIGIGTLGFESSFLTQACPLKVREYWARGIPFVIAYEDADLINNAEMQPFFLRLEVKDGLIDVNEVISFAKKLYASGDVVVRLRELAARQIDYRVKAMQYVSFINSLPK